jgi:hypothetical protein
MRVGGYPINQAATKFSELSEYSDNGATRFSNCQNIQILFATSVLPFSEYSEYLEHKKRA